jgi:hypothetical protein
MTASFVDDMEWAAKLAIRWTPGVHLGVNGIKHNKPPESFVAQRRHGIHAHGSLRRNVGGGERDDR